MRKLFILPVIAVAGCATPGVSPPDIVRTVNQPMPQVSSCLVARLEGEFGASSVRYREIGGAARIEHYESFGGVTSRKFVFDLTRVDASTTRVAVGYETGLLPIVRNGVMAAMSACAP